MSPVAVAALESWSFRPLPLVLLALATVLYSRGWRELHRQMPERFPRWRLVAFLCAIAALVLAIASPLDALGGFLLSVHMLQHFLLTMVAAPLFWLGTPQIPLLRGLPLAIAKNGLGPFLAWPALQRALRRLSHPVTAFALFSIALWSWHLPALYELALRSRGWHEIEHACFFASALLFWWPIVQPWPSVGAWPRWAVVPYLALADLQNTAFSALFIFSERILYPSYAALPRVGGLSPLEDQALAGALMWVPGQVAFLVPIGVILTGLLSPTVLRSAGYRRSGVEDLARLRSASTRRTCGSPRLGRWRESLRRARSSTPSSWSPRRSAFDLLAVPVLGSLLRRLATRRVAQGFLLVGAVAVVVDGFAGPAMAPMNLAGVLPWTYFRGLSVVALLVAGNLFCFACPFMLPREVGKRLFSPERRWPRFLRSKGLAVALLVAWFVAYEAFDLWNSPAATAWIVVGYFAAACAVDGLFRGASFCKYVCPIGQFHFVASTVSPLEVRVRELDVCSRCTTHDCLRGRDERRGCETDLFLPRKAGNLDCTFCLDCARACPHDNVGLVAVVPGADLARDVRRSSLGRLSHRSDVAALVLVLVFAAFANAAGMTPPFAAAEGFVARSLALSSPSAAQAIVLLASLVAAPLVAVLACAAAGRRLARLHTPLGEIVCRFALALIPLGVGMGAAHLLFHLATGAGAAIPVAQRVALDLGAPLFGAPDWSMGAAATSGWLLPAKLLLLDAGLCLTIVLVWRIAGQVAPEARRALGLVGPWAGLATALWLAGVWILLQPMEMRGAMVH